MGRPANDPIYAFPRSIYDLVETFASPEEAAEIYRAVLRYYFEGVEIAPEEVGDERTACLVRSFLGRVACARRSALAKSESGKSARSEDRGERGDGLSKTADGKPGGLGAEKHGEGSRGVGSCREVRTEVERESNISNTQAKGLPSKREVEEALKDCSRKLGIPVGDAGEEAASFLAYNAARGWRLSGGVRAEDWRPLATKWVLAMRSAQESPERARKRAAFDEGGMRHGSTEFRRIAASLPAMREGFGNHGRP